MFLQYSGYAFSVINCNSYQPKCSFSDVRKGTERYRHKDILAEHLLSAIKALNNNSCMVFFVSFVVSFEDCLC